MRTSLIILALLALAMPASAIDTNRYPHTLYDQACTDDNDTPAAETLPIAYFDGTYNPPATLQVSGSPDGFCDTDSRIRTGAETSDRLLGPFSSRGIRGVYPFVDADTVLDGTPTWRLSVLAVKAHDGVAQVLDQSAVMSGTGNEIFLFGTDVGDPNQPSSSPNAILEVPLPDRFILWLELMSATSITADISVMPWTD